LQKLLKIRELVNGELIQHLDDDDKDDDGDYNYDDDDYEDDDNNVADYIIGSRNKTCVLRGKKFPLKRFKYQQIFFPRVDHLIKYHWKSCK
jgi:hypothetical protein